MSALLLVLLARGNVALAAVLNAVNTALSPFIVCTAVLRPVVWRLKGRAA